MAKINLRSWGRHFNRSSNKFSEEEFFDNIGYGGMAVGNSRSYNDAPMSKSSFFIKSKKIEIDKITKTVRVSAGVTLEELIEETIALKLMPIVVPGTAKVSIGGAIAANIHGKNHHKSGSFCDHVLSMDVMLSDGRQLQTNAGEELFENICGSFGMLALIKEATIQLEEVPSKMLATRKQKMSLAKMVETMRKDDATYTVAWLDTSDFNGRGIYMSGEWVASEENKNIDSRPKTKKAPKLPSWLLASSLVLNTMSKGYYTLIGNKEGLESFNKFFFPLDAIDEWDCAYGEKGMIQVQVVFPDSEEVFYNIRHVLELMRQRSVYSFVTVLKRFGDEGVSRFYNKSLNFQIENGFTLALDFSVSNKSLELAKEITEYAHRAGGRAYLAKDAIMGKEDFKKGYGQQAEHFLRIKKIYDKDMCLVGDMYKRLMKE